MDVYVVDFNGRGVLALNTDNQPEAEEFIASHISGAVGDTVLRDDLMRLREDSGAPMWDGTQPLHIRPASSAEKTTWKTWHKKVCESEGTPEGYDAATGEGFLCCWILSRSSPDFVLPPRQA